MKLATLHDLYVSELRDLYNAEQQLLRAIPRMASASSAPELRESFEFHFEDTRRQLTRLDRIFGLLDISPNGKRCLAMEGLIAEGKELLSEDAEPSVRDAALIVAAQRIEHYEMASYGCVRTFAQLLGYDEAAAWLQESLDEEGASDERLTELAESVINVEAVSMHQ